MDGNFETDDLFLASYLVCRGFPVIRTTQNDRKVKIVFGGNGADKCNLEYVNGGMVEGRKFTETYVTLRKMVKQEDKFKRRS